MFETGSNRWRSFDAWPPAVRATPLYFVEGQLQRNPPAASSGFDEYVSDPAKPVPFIHWIATGMPREYMVGDQRQFSSRPDVLTYESEPLEDDLTIAGPISVSLLVSTTGTDADFVVKLIDVYPDDFPDNPGGYQQLLRGEPFRARFRNGFEKSEPMQPGKMEKIAYEMPDVLHCFRRGHRVMVQVQSTWFPLVDRNPQKFVADIPNARAADFQKATHRVCRGSRIVVGVLP